MFNDDYKIDEQWQKIKRLLNENDAYYKTTIESDIYRFIGERKNKEASVRARNKLNQVRILCEELRASILKQRQDNQSKY
jgi:hypothetical protein